MTSIISTGAPASPAGSIGDTVIPINDLYFLFPPANATLVVGTEGDDVLAGSAKPEYFIGYYGRDKIDGGAEVDTVEIRANHDSVTLRHDSVSGNDIVSSTLAANDVATVRNVERLQFADCVVALNVGGGAVDAAQAAYSALAQKLYIAYFGRPADHFGLEAIVGQLSAAHAPVGRAIDFLAAVKDNAALANLVANFAGSPESSVLYKGDTAHFVMAVYQNVLGREPDLDGLAYWSQAIDSGKLARPMAALSILAGAELNTSAQGQIDAQVLNNRVLAATNFNLALDSLQEYNAYAGNSRAALARDMLAQVDQHTNALAFESTVLETIWKVSHGPVDVVPVHADAAPLELVGVVQAFWMA
jgi:serralysin